jgi:hypothetical protein
MGIRTDFIADSRALQRLFTSRISRLAVPRGLSRQMGSGSGRLPDGPGVAVASGLIAGDL